MLAIDIGTNSADQVNRFVTAKFAIDHLKHESIVAETHEFHVDLDQEKEFAVPVSLSNPISDRGIPDEVPVL
jgi:hypothetical protein